MAIEIPAADFAKWGEPLGEPRRRVLDSLDISRGGLETDEFAKFGQVAGQSVAEVVYRTQGRREYMRTPGLQVR